MKNGVLIAVLLLLVAGMVSAYLFKPEEPEQALPTELSQSATPEPQQSPSQQPEAIPAGSSVYESPGSYRLVYPNEYIVEAADDTPYTRIYKRGATQRGQTEMYDGVILVLEAVALEGKPLSEVVDARITAATADGTSEVLEPKQATALNGNPGFSYQLRGLGSSSYLIVQKSEQSNSAVSITYLVADPENRGYQEEVNAILSTVELLK